MSHRDRTHLFPFFLVFLEVSTYLANDMYLPALPDLARSLAIDNDTVKYTLIYWFFGAASLQLFIGPISDRIGRKKVILMAASVFTLTSMICALTSDFTLFLVSRFFEGSCVGAVIVAGYAAIHEQFSGKKAVQILALMGSITVLAPSLGPLVGALILEYTHAWRAIFWVLVLFGSMSLLGLHYTMPETLKVPSHLHPKTILKDYLSLIRNATFFRFVLIQCFIISVFMIWIVETPFIIIDALGESGKIFGLAQTLVFTGFFIGPQITKRLIHHVPIKWLVQNGLMGANFFALIFLITSIWGQLPLFITILPMLGLSICASMTFAPLNRLTIEASPLPMGRKMAIVSLMVSLSGGMASFVTTLIPAHRFSHLAFLILMATITSFTLYRGLSGNVSLQETQE